MMEVKLSSNGIRLAASAIRHQKNSAVKVFEYNEPWSQLGNDIDGEANDDESDGIFH